MLMLLYSTGVRVSELVSLPLAGCNMESGFLKVVGKGNKERLIPFGTAAAEAIAGYLQGSRPLLLKGTVTLVTASGREAWSGTRCALCRCGASKDKPFCDGSHRRIGFKSD